MKILCVEKMELGPIATNAFLLWEENGDGNAVLIDAPPFARDSVEEVLERQKIKLKKHMAYSWTLGPHGWSGRL